MTDSPNKFIQRIKAGLTQDTVFIIGGGPSVLKIVPDPAILSGKHIIATNNAYQLFPDALFCHFADRAWYNWHYARNFPTLFKDRITTATGSEQRVWLDSGVTPFNKTGQRKGITTDIECVYGMNAGHQAINIAVHLGFKKICLIGYDLHPDVQQTHWHNQHENRTLTDNYTQLMIPGFEQIPPFQEELRFTVYNLNRESNLKCFEFADLKDFL